MDCDTDVSAAESNEGAPAGVLRGTDLDTRRARSLSVTPPPSPTVWNESSDRSVIGAWSKQSSPLPSADTWASLDRKSLFMSMSEFRWLTGCKEHPSPSSFMGRSTDLCAAAEDERPPAVVVGDTRPGWSARSSSVTPPPSPATWKWPEKAPAAREARDERRSTSHSVNKRAGKRKLEASLHSPRHEHGEETSSGKTAAVVSEDVGRKRRRLRVT